MVNFPELLNQEAEAIGLFISALQGEQDALKTANIDALPAFGEQKGRTIALLRRLGQERNAFLRASKLGTDRDGLITWGKTSADAEALVNRFLALAEEAKELNRLNGQLISLRLRNTQAALSALGSENDKKGLYRSNGHAEIVPATGYRLIDSV